MIRFIRNVAMATLIALSDELNRITGRYEGAQHSTQRSHLPGAVQSARFDASASARTELVRKARYFEQNSAIMNRMADIFECYTAGSKFQITPASSDPEWNKRAKAWWDQWCRYPDLTSRQTFGTLCSLMARTWFVDGECFILLTRGNTGRPRIQLFEGHLVGTPPSLAHLEGSSIVDGTVVDPNGRPIAYYIASEDARGQKIYGTPRPADFVIHLFEPSRPGQYRGIPFTHPVVNTLHDLDDLQILEMKAAKEAARTINFVKKKSGELNTDELRRRRFQQSTTLKTGESVNNTESEYYQDAVGGETIVGQPGDEMERLSSDRPSVVTREYWRELKSDACAGVGIPYVLVYPESMQGTVYRGALDMANSYFRTRFEVVADAARRVYEFVMDWARYNEPTLRDAPGDWKAVSIHAPRAVNVDVGRNTTALLKELEYGATTYDQVYGPLGLDWREQFDHLKQQQDYAGQIGLNIPGAKPPAEPQSQPEPANA